MSLIGAALIGAGGSLLSGVTNQLFGRSNQAYANDWSEKMQQQQQEWQEYMWNKNNEYNDPASQIQRLRDAGVNPNTAAGSMGATSQAQMPQQPTIPSSNPMMSPGFDFSNGVNSGLAYQEAQANIDKTNAEKDFIKSQTEGKQLENSVYLADKNVQWAVSHSQVKLNEANEKYISSVLTNKTQAEIENLNKQGQLIEEQKKQVSEEINLIKEKMKTEHAQQGLLSQMTEESGARTSVDQVQKQLMDLEYKYKNITVDASLKSGIPLDDLRDYEKINTIMKNNGNSDEQIKQFWKDASRPTASQVRGVENYVQSGGIPNQIGNSFNTVLNNQTKGVNRYKMSSTDWNKSAWNE